MCGDPIAPALSIISSPSTTNSSPSDTASIPVALGFDPLLSNKILFTDTLALMVKLRRCLDRPRYPIAVDHLTPLGLFNGIGLTPVVPGALASSHGGNPAFNKACSNALDPWVHSSLGNLCITIGPSDPWKSPGSSLYVVSVSILLKYGIRLRKLHSSLPHSAQLS